MFFKAKARFLLTTPVSLFNLKLKIINDSAVYFTKIAPNMQVESSATPLLTVYEVENIQRQKLASLVGHLYQLTYAVLLDSFVHEEKLNHCYCCAINHQRDHSCVMMDSEDAWMYYHDDVTEKIDMNVVLKTTESV